MRVCHAALSRLEGVGSIRELYSILPEYEGCPMGRT